MKPLLVEQAVEDFRQCDSFKSLSDTLVKVAQELGFDHHAMIQANSSRTDVGSLVSINYPEAFMRHQAETLGYYHSPILLAVRTQCAPFEWRDLAGLIDLKPAHEEYLQMAASFGLRQGFTVPIHQPGEASGFVSFVKSADDRPSADTLAITHFLATHAFTAGRRIRDLAANRPRQMLHERDRIVITMIARGSSKFAIAKKLGVREEMIVESLKRIKAHYRVGSQTQAVVQALYDRSIGFDDVVG